MSRRRSLLIPLLALAVGGFAQNTADTGSHARIVRISYLQGTVQYSGAAAVMNSPVIEDSRLVTGTDGVAEVEFEDRSAIRLASETQVSFAQLARLSSGEARTRVDLEDGEAEFLIPASSAGRFAVNVRGKNILFTEPGRFRIVSTQATPLEMAVWKGEAEVRDLESGKAVTVKARATFALNPENLGQYNVENLVLADNLDRWSEQRDRDLRTNYVVSNTYNTVYNDYYQTGGYGYVAPGAYPLGFYGSNAFGCASGFVGFGQPFWFGSPCWNSGFLINPFFLSPPIVVIVAPPIRPHRPVPIHPPTPATVAKASPGSTPENTAARPGFRSFSDQPGSPDGAARAGVEAGSKDVNVPHIGIKPGVLTLDPIPNSVMQTVATPSTAPGRHPTGGNVRPLTGSGLQHSSPPAAHPAFSGPRGPSGGFSHGSAPAAHPSGRGR